MLRERLLRGTERLRLRHWGARGHLLVIALSAYSPATHEQHTYFRRSFITNFWNVEVFEIYTLRFFACVSQMIRPCIYKDCSKSSWNVIIAKLHLNQKVQRPTGLSATVTYSRM